MAFTCLTADVMLDVVTLIKGGFEEMNYYFLHSHFPLSDILLINLSVL